MKKLFLFFAIVMVLGINSVVAEEIKKGDKLQTLSNIHPDMGKNVWYTMNYQLPGLIPICEEIEVVKVKSKKMIFKWKGQEFTAVFDKHTRKKAGKSFQEALAPFFGPKCDEEKLAALDEKDQGGVKKGTAAIGMTKEGVLLAMGRPPFHVNPDLEVDSWTYWRNRFARKVISFDEDGKVVEIR